MKLALPEPSSKRSGICENSDFEAVDDPLNSHEFRDGIHGRAESSRFRWMLVLTVCFVLALAGPFLVGRVYTADDLGAFHLPMRAFYADCLARGEPFDWSPQMYCGVYLTGEGQIGGYHPLHLLLYRLLPLPVAFDLECLLSYPIMLVGMFLLLWRWGIRRDAALFGGFTFAFSSFSLLHFVHVNGVAVVAHLPWLLLAIHAVVCGNDRNRRLLGGVGIALLTGSQLLLGYPQYVWFSLLVELGYVSLLSRSRLPDGTRVSPSARKRSRPAVGTYFAIGLWLALGATLGAIQWLPTLDALWHSSRASVGSDFTGWGSLDPLNLVQLVAPYLFKTRVVGQNTHELGLYAGSVTFILAVLCLANRPNDDRLRLFRRGAIVLVVAGLLLALGDHGPVGWIVAKLPLVNSFRFPCRAIVLIDLGLAVLATVGLVSLPVGVPVGSEPQRQRPPLGGAVSPRRDHGILSAIVALSVFLAIAGPVLWPDNVAASSLVWTGPLLIALAAGLVVLARQKGKWAIPALMLMSAVDLGAYGVSYAVYPQSASLDEYLASIPRPPGPPRRRVALDLLAANQSGLHAGNQMVLRGYERADGYAGLEPLRQLDYRQAAALRLAGVEWVAQGADVADRKALAGPTTDRWLRIENPLPRARLVSHVVQSTEPKRDLTMIPIESSALVELPLELNPGLPGTATILADRPGDIRVAVDSPSRQLLVLAESAHSGWQATIDGHPRPVLRVNGDFMGCVVNAGKSEIHFEFRPASLRYGRWLSILGLGLIGAAMLVATLTRSVSEG
jgi:hypothetical protein